MPYHSLSDFLEELLAAGELLRVRTPVDPELEIAEITARCAAAGGPALLFDRVQGHDLAVVTNLLGTEARACRALGVPSLAALAERMSQLARPGGSQSWLERLRGGEAMPLEKFRAKPARQAACQQAVRLGRDIDLTSLPALRCWPGESGRVLTGRLILVDGESQQTSLRQVRAVVVDRKHVAILDTVAIDRGRGGSLLAGESLPAAIALGGDPAATLAAALDWTNLDGYVLAGLLRNQPWDVAQARSQPLMVPADADMIIEGVMHRGLAAQENFGTQTPALGQAAVTRATVAHATSGYYTDPRAEPWLLEVGTMTHRANPVLPLLVAGDLSAGCPVGETAVLHRVRDCLLRPLLSAAIPELADCSLPPVGGPCGYAVLAIRKSYAGQARRAAHALWGLPALEPMKCVVVVDADVDVHTPAEVLGRIAANVSPDRDVFFQTGPGSPDDHAAPQPGLGEHVGIDATAKLPPEHPRPWPHRLERPAELREAVSRRWAEYGLPPI
jgi:4-hydroxy-3-polyprenylbenzoate decarboxylase